MLSLEEVVLFCFLLVGCLLAWVFLKLCGKILLLSVSGTTVLFTSAMVS